MPAAPLSADLPQSLDAVHLQVRDAFARVDLSTYARYLAPDLRYVEPRGRVRTRTQLLASLHEQFARLVSFRTTFTRDALEVNGDEVTERGVQEATIALRVFALFEVRWQITRRGQYTWRRAPEVAWQLREALVEAEDIRRAGFGWAGRAAYGDPPERGAA
jgi:ketosteroid isomerase-like protein